MFQVDGVALAARRRVNGVVDAVVEDDTVLQNLANRRAFVLLSGLHQFHYALVVGGHGTSEEVAACTKRQLSGAEWVFNRSVRRRLRHKSAWRSG